jgi:hypothetical protein
MKILHYDSLYNLEQTKKQKFSKNKVNKLREIKSS